ncbi:MAG: CoA transferase, partial [Burkholderiaceae bacterium]
MIKSSGKPEDKETLLNLLKKADVFISNIRPRALKKLGLSYADLQPLNPRLIYCAAVGFGQDGPYAEKP